MSNLIETTSLPMSTHQFIVEMKFLNNRRHFWKNSDVDERKIQSKFNFNFGNNKNKTLFFLSKCWTICWAQVRLDVGTSIFEILLNKSVQEKLVYVFAKNCSKPLGPIEIPARICDTKSGEKSE